MPKRDEHLLLADIVDNIEFILTITKGLTKEEFFENRLVSFAADRSFEIIGEAARQLPDVFIAMHNDVEWNKMISFRNLLIHEYFRVERSIQWNIIQNILPGLFTQLQKIIEDY